MEEKRKWPRTERWAELGVFQEGGGQLSAAETEEEKASGLVIITHYLGILVVCLGCRLRNRRDKQRIYK